MQALIGEHRGVRVAFGVLPDLGKATPEIRPPSGLGDKTKGDTDAEPCAPPVEATRRGPAEQDHSHQSEINLIFVPAGALWLFPP